MLTFKLEYTVITVQYDPPSNTDYLLTKQEQVFDSPLEAEQFQQSKILELNQEEGHYRCYIQERECYVIQTGKRTSTVTQKHCILKTRNIIEI